MKSKNVRNYLIVLSLFLLIMSIIIIVFMNIKEKISYENTAYLLNNYLYDMDEGTYELRDGFIYTTGNYLYSDEKFSNGNGVMSKNKYGLISFNIDYDNFCAYKTILGEVKISKKCPKLNEINFEITRNNKDVTFVTNVDKVYYLTSEYDDFSLSNNNWKQSKNSSVILEATEDPYNVWFKDKDGNFSGPHKVYSDCFYSNGLNYSSDLYYCKTSVVILDNKEWIVLNDSNENTTLMLKNSLEEKMSHCTNKVSQYCFNTGKLNINYKWSNSYINNYLNTIFINEFSDDVKSKLLDNEICDESNSEEYEQEYDNGFLIGEETYEELYCDKSTTSKVRLATINEINNIDDEISEQNKNIWLMVSKNNEGTIFSNISFYSGKNFTEKHYVNPVIVISKD